jgi:hypothetical protein
MDMSDDRGLRKQRAIDKLYSAILDIYDVMGNPDTLAVDRGDARHRKEVAYIYVVMYENGAMTVYGNNVPMAGEQ